MRRIDIRSSPAHTRLFLRERLTRFLPHRQSGYPVVTGPSQVRLCDSDLVSLLVNLQVSAGNDVNSARQLYEENCASPDDASEKNAVAHCTGSEVHGLSAEAPNKVVSPTPAATLKTNAELPSTSELNDQEQPANISTSAYIFNPPPTLESLVPAPSFDELIERGWIWVSWERFSVPREIVYTVLRDEGLAARAFKALIARSDDDVLSISPSFTPSQEVQVVATDVVNGKLKPSEIACVSHAWVAAKLWSEIFRRNDQDTLQKISRWVDIWELLGFPYFSLSSFLETSEAEAFVETAISFLTAIESSPDWDRFRRAALAPTVLLYPYQASAVDSILPPVPRTTIDRERWLSERVAQNAMQDFMQSKASSLFAALVNELQASAYDPRRTALRLLDAALPHPVYLHQFAVRASREPALLADMLMTPATCPLACGLIANWAYRGDGWFHDLSVRSNHATSLLAFEDAVSILGGHIDAGQVPSEELAALYLQIFELANHHRAEARRPEMLSLLREEVSGAGEALRIGVVATLLSRANAADGLGAFCALLDLAAEGGCIDLIAQDSAVGIYLENILPNGQALRPGFLEAPGAAALTELAFRCEANMCSRYLSAIEIATWLQTAPTAEDQRFSFIQQTLRRVRLHIRVLSRAVAGWPGKIRPELANALPQAVRAGADDNPDRGRLDAFALGLHFDQEFGPQERPIALDLSAALLRLEGLERQSLLTSLCQVNEPAVLAGIVAEVPHDFSSQLRMHLQTLTPSNSSNAYTLSALQTRISTLLDAGLPDIAVRFMEDERAAIPGRRVPHREIASVRSDLLSKYLIHEWQAIMCFQVPATVPEAERQEANEAVAFFRALTHLRMPGGDVRQAEGELIRLSQRNPASTSYLTNLFASRVQRLLAEDSLKQLSGTDRAEAVRTIGDVLREVRPALQHSTRDLNAFDTNLALLLLAVNQPRESLHFLLDLRDRTYEPRVEALRALALARIGCTREALEVLRQAERVFGPLELFSGIRANIDGHRPFRTAPTLSLEDNPVPGLRHAYAAIRRLGHTEQAEVLEAHGRLDLFLLEHVRGACSSLVALVPMMRNLGVLKFEDDINSILKQVLLSRLLHVEWQVSDQSRGGFSGSGGVGERDLEVAKGSATLAVIEALIVDSVERGNLTFHFNKLLGYATCRFFFHVTYVRRANCDAVVAHLKAASQSPTPGISYVRSEDLPDVDSMPIGFQVLYRIDSRDVQVVFLVLDMNQQVQRSAATAASSHSRPTA